MGHELFARHPAGYAGDVIANELRFIHVTDDDEPAAVEFVHLRGGRAGLLVRVLAVDDCGEAVFRIALHPLPDMQHRAARRIDQDAPDILQLLEVVKSYSERRHDCNVLRRDSGEVESARLVGVDEGDPHVGHPLVHIRIVDDLTDQIDLLLREVVHSFVGVVDGPIDAVAEAELVREPDGDIPELAPVPV